MKAPAGFAMISAGIGLVRFAEVRQEPCCQTLGRGNLLPSLDLARSHSI